MTQKCIICGRIIGNFGIYCPKCQEDLEKKINKRGDWMFTNNLCRDFNFSIDKKNFLWENNLIFIINKNPNKIFVRIDCFF